jgi:hypothetical protein
MTTLDWPTVRERAIRAFAGNLPHPETEDAVIAVFEQQPLAVLRAIDEISDDIAAGRVRSGWAVLRSRLAAATEARSDVRVTAPDERERRLAAAEAWMRHAGLHVASEAEVRDELFGERGKLHAWASDDALRVRLLELWRRVRPEGEQIELEELERAEHHKRARAAVEAQEVRR